MLWHSLAHERVWPADAVDQPLVEADYCRPHSAASFTAVEWLVIADGALQRSSALCWSRLRPLLVTVYGRNSHDAHERLEALHTMSTTVARCGWAAPAKETVDFLRAGWSEQQLDLLVASLEAD